MLIYKNNGKLFCISKKALQLAGYHDIEHFNTEHNDYCELFVKQPGYIYNFENFSWLSFLRNANKEQKRVLISTKDNAVYECELDIETVYPVEFDEDTPEFFYQIEFKNLRLSNGSAPTGEDFEVAAACETGFEEKLLKEAYTQNDNAIHEQSPFHEKSPFDTESETEQVLASVKEEEKEEEKHFEFGIPEETPPPAQTKEEDKPLDLVDFQFDLTEQKSEEESQPLFTRSDKKEEVENEPLATPEIGLKTEPIQPQQKSEKPQFFEAEEPQIALQDTAFENEPAAVASVQSVPPREPSVEIPDIQKVSSTLGLPEEMVKEFIKEFVTTYINDLPEVKAALISDNIHIVKKEAMKLKGIAANLRMEQLSRMLETVLTTKSGSDLTSAWNDIDAYMRSLIPLYAPELASTGSSERESYTLFESVEESVQKPSSTLEEQKESIQKSPKALKLEEKDVGETIIFDPNEAADALGLPESLILEFVSDFIEQARDEIKNFEKAYEEGDIKTINEVAHKLKGVAANLRIEDMRQLMENVQHANNPKEVEKELIDFYHKLAALTKMMAKEYA